MFIKEDKDKIIEKEKLQDIEEEIEKIIIEEEEVEEDEEDIIENNNKIINENEKNSKLISTTNIPAYYSNDYDYTTLSTNTDTLSTISALSEKAIISSSSNICGEEEENGNISTEGGIGLLISEVIPWILLARTSTAAFVISNGKIIDE